MRQFTSQGNWKHLEKNVIENETQKKFVLTQPKRIFDEDYYTVRRAVACEDVPADVVPENDFYVYEILYMENGSSLSVKIVDEDTAKELKTFVSEAVKSCAELQLIEHRKHALVAGCSFLEQYFKG